MSIVTSLFIVEFIDLDHLSLFLLRLAKGLSILCIFSKNQLLVPLIFSVFFLSVYFFYVCFDVYSVCP